MKAPGVIERVHRGLRIGEHMMQRMNQWSELISYGLLSR